MTDYNSLTIYNLDNNKKYKIAISKGEIEKGMKKNELMFPEDLFSTPIVEKGKLVLKYSTEKYRKGKQPKYKIINIDLKKYSS